MVDSGFGRTDLAQPRQRRVKARWTAEAHHGRVREPGTVLALVHTERLEPRVQVGRERGCTSSLVVEHKHPDAARLAIATEREARNGRRGGGLAQVPCDSLHLSRSEVSEERERDVDVCARDDPDVTGP